MFPIAWAVVDVENHENQSWFLNPLIEDLGTSRGAMYTIMSDQQKGLVKAISKVLVEVEVQCCDRHVLL